MAWCFYGNLVSKAEDGTEKIDAVAYITQFVQPPNMPQLEGIGIRPFQSGFMFNTASDTGYFVSADAALTPNPAVTVTSNPWSVVTNYEQTVKQIAEQSTNCIAVVDGEMGAVGTKYKLAADVFGFNYQEVPIVCPIEVPKVKYSRLYSEIGSYGYCWRRAWPVQLFCRRAYT